MNTSDKIKALRSLIKSKSLDGYLIPRTDEYQGEYVPACAERLKWLTGFDGSAGMAAVLAEGAVVMSDGRYTIQLAQQVESQIFETADMVETPLADWLTDNAPKGARIGYDPMLFTPAQIEALGKASVELVSVAGNLIDEIWSDRPAVPCGAVEIFPEDIAGRSAVGKCAQIAEIIQKEGGDAFVLTDPQSIAWLLNIRGSDIPHIPLALSRAVIYAEGKVDWFVDEGKISEDMKSHLSHIVILYNSEMLAESLAGVKAEEGGEPIVLLDLKRSPIWFKQTLEEAGVSVKDCTDPCILPRACKTDAEQAAIIETHIRDGVALTRFLHWVDTEGPKGHLTELDIVAKREEFSRLDPAYREPSFDTISGWAENGAIVHYCVNKETNKAIKPSGLLLVDSGGQYCGDGIAGTTDVTRTVAIGVPSDEMRENFTRVLKGHVALASTRFPEGTTGPQLDTLARKALWDAGRDYDHGTGHGVGCYLSVHEDAAHISKRAAMAFAPGMLISNEPGYYKVGAYGIRIESLVFVVENGVREGTDKKMLGFETVTLAPIDRRLIVKDMLSPEEWAWLNDYHARVYETLAPRLAGDVKAWLAEVCGEI